MAETGFRVKYDGPALATGQMPVRELAPALLALADLFVEASTVLYPKLDPPALNIKATEKGSFDVLLILHGPEIWDQIVNFFSSEDANALANLRDFVVGPASVVALIAWLRRRRIKREERLENGQVRLMLEDGTVADFPSETVALYRRVTVRKKAKTVVSPVGRPGVNELEFRTETEVTVHIGPEDVPAFDPEPDEPTPLVDEESEVVLAIVSPVFKENNKWRFSDGENEFAAAIEDPAFIERVNAGEPFAAGDKLRCRLRVVQTEQNGKLRIERHVVQVIDHMRRPPTETLFDD